MPAAGRRARTRSRRGIAGRRSAGEGAESAKGQKREASTVRLSPWHLDDHAPAAASSLASRGGRVYGGIRSVTLGSGDGEDVTPS
jgi:hypothetical protein